MTQPAQVKQAAILDAGPVCARWAAQGNRVNKVMSLRGAERRGKPPIVAHVSGGCRVAIAPRNDSWTNPLLLRSYDEQL
jgi:hypothetical protein